MNLKLLSLFFMIDYVVSSADNFPYKYQSSGSTVLDVLDKLFQDQDVESTKKITKEQLQTIFDIVSENRDSMISTENWNPNMLESIKEDIFQKFDMISHDKFVAECSMATDEYREKTQNQEYDSDENSEEMDLFNDYRGIDKSNKLTIKEIEDVLNSLNKKWTREELDLIKENLKSKSEWIDYDWFISECLEVVVENTDMNSDYTLVNNKIDLLSQELDKQNIKENDKITKDQLVNVFNSMAEKWDSEELKLIKTHIYNNIDLISFEDLIEECSIPMNEKLLDKAFKDYDVNKAGVIRKDEIVTVLESLPTNWDQDELIFIKEHFQRNINTIDYNDFIEASLEALHNFMNYEEQQKMENDPEKWFLSHDVDGNGEITPKELCMTLSVDQSYFDIRTCQQMIREMDLNNNGTVDYAEFAKSSEINNTDTNDLCTDKFQKIDENDDSKIIKEELRTFFEKEFGENKTSDCMINNTFNELDVDMDGNITKKEFNAECSNFFKEI